MTPSRERSFATRVRSARAEEAGETLIEILATTMIIGLVLVAILTGFETSLFASSTYSDNAHEETVLTTYAESLKNAALQTPPSCTTTYAPGPVDANGFQAKVVSTSFWDPSVNQFQATCPATPLKLVEVVVGVSGPRAASQQVTVVLGTRT